MLLLASCCMRTYALECCTGTRTGGGLGALTLRGEVTLSSGGWEEERSMVLMAADVEAVDAAGEGADEVVEGEFEEQPANA